MEKEVWKEVKGFEGYYKVSSFGNVVSMDRKVPLKKGRKRFLKGLKMKTYLSNKYLKVDLRSIDNGIHKKYIHRLVAENFIKNPENKRIVNHKDGNKLNNHKNNLEWVSHRENINHKHIKRLDFSCVKKDYKKFRSAIRIKGETVNIGSFNTEKEAALALKEYVLKNNISTRYMRLI